MDVFLLLLLSESLYQSHGGSLASYKLAVYFALSWFFSVENSATLKI